MKMKSNVNKEVIESILIEQRKIVTMLEDLLKQDEEIQERYLTASELASILCVERGTVTNWIKKNIIKVNQERKNCKTQISLNEIEKVINTSLSKYKNLWFNYNQ